MHTSNVSIRYLTKGKLPSLPFVEIKNEILTKEYELSIACVSKKTATELNIIHRKKDYTPNILSFSLTKKSGEIILHIPTIKKQYKSFKMSYTDYVLYLLIHGCLHLKGLDHGVLMDKKELLLKKKFKIMSS